MDYIANIFSSAAGILIVYFLVRRWKGKSGKEFNLKFFKYISIFFVLSVLLSTLGSWLMSGPELVSEAVKQLKVDAELRRRIGSYKGHGFNENDIYEIKELPATFNLILYGSKANAYLTVFADSSADIIEIKKYQVDSVKSE